MSFNDTVITELVKVRTAALDIRDNLYQRHDANIKPLKQAEDHAYHAIMAAYTGAVLAELEAVLGKTEAKAITTLMDNFSTGHAWGVKPIHERIQQINQGLGGKK